MANNPKATDNLTAPRFEPGKSGNPGGISSETRRLINENAERAVRVRAAMLAKAASLIDPETGLFMGDMGGDLLRLVKDSEDRGLGAPHQTVDNTHDVSDRMLEGAREFRSKLARVASRSRPGGDPS